MIFAVEKSVSRCFVDSFQINGSRYFFYSVSFVQIYIYMILSDTIRKIENRVKTLFAQEGTGHDWHHINRVRNTALKIAQAENSAKASTSEDAKAEGADLFLVELAALLHDIADHKFHNHDLSVGPERAREIVLKETHDSKLADQIATIVSEVSFKGAGVETPVSSPEAAVVQDADRLDALGAIGIARAFAYGGHKNRPIYDPEVQSTLHDNFEDYAKKGSHTINHFYEKLLLLKDRMNTNTGKKLAAERHRFMEEYLEQFYAEWKGVR